MTAPTTRASAEPSSTTRLWLVRHGRTAFNAIGRFQGQTDVPLDDVGRRQADALGRRLATWRLDRVVASDLSRASQTAERVLARRPGDARPTLELDPRLREIGLGELEGCDHGDFEARFPGIHAAWRRAPSSARFPGGETLADVQGRAYAAVEAIRESSPGQHVLVVAHGFALLSVLARMLGLELDRFRGLWLDGTGLCEVRWGRSGPSVRRINDTAHLEGTDLA